MGRRVEPARRRDPAAEDWVAVKALAVLAGDSERAAAEITAEADAAGLEGSRRSGPMRASATWETSASSCTTTRPWKPAGRSRPASSRAHAAIS